MGALATSVPRTTIGQGRERFERGGCVCVVCATARQESEGGGG